MVSYRTEIAVDRPAAEVFPFLADINRYAEWMGGKRAVTLTDGPMANGYRYRYETEEGTFEMEVTDLVPGRAVTTRTVSGPMEWSGTFEVVPEGPTSSRVRSEGEIHLRGVKRLAEPFVGGEIRRSEQQELVRLKALVESSADA